MTDFLPTLVIHLDRAVLRKSNVEVLLDEFSPNATIVPGVESTSFDETKLRSFLGNYHKPGYPFSLRLAEIATFLSHRSCWKEIVERKLSYALILEDDVVLEPEFHTALALAISKLTTDNFIRFPVKNRERCQRLVSSQGSTRIFEPTVVGLGMQAQLVTLGAAKRLLSQTMQFDRPIDAYMQMRWVHKIEILTIQNSGISEKSHILGGSHISKQKPILEYLWREISRPIYRLAIFIKSRR